MQYLVDWNKYESTIKKTCLVCNEIVYKRKRDTYKKWKKRKYCSHICYNTQKKYKIVSIETKEKISKSNKGRKISKSTRIKISNSKKGSILSKETRKKISETLKSKNLRGPNNPKWLGGRAKHRDVGNPRAYFRLHAALVRDLVADRLRPHFGEPSRFDSG